MEKRTQSALKKLEGKRRRIDLLDQKLLALLNQRLRVALEIGKTKKGMGKEIYDPGREKKVLEKLKLRNRGPFKEQVWTLRVDADAREIGPVSNAPQPSIKFCKVEISAKKAWNDHDRRAITTRHAQAVVHRGGVQNEDLRPE